MTVQVLYWQDVPSVVKGPDGSKQQLPDSFQQEIDRRAMEQGLVGSDAYLEHWHWEEVEGTLDEVVAALRSA
ncbi:MAG TPA: virulence factor [Gaiellaceae bacterium]|nr:virulence factor [Gaiellaceae bacterium]